MKALLPLAFLVFVSLLPAFGQVGLDNTTPDPSSVLSLSSTEGGLLVPRMTTQQREAIVSPANSLLVFDTSENRYFYYDNDRWNPVSPWSVSDPNVYYETGNVGIGTSDPQYTLDVNGSINTTALHINGSPFPVDNFHPLSNGTVAKTVTGDWNDYKETGFYMGNRLDNESPGIHWWRYVTVIKHNDNNIIQKSTDFDNVGTYQRVLTNGNWTPWRRIISSATWEFQTNDLVVHGKRTLVGHISPLSEQLHINYGNDFSSGTRVHGNLVVTGSITELGGTYSDIRLKDNIAPIENALGRVLLIEGVTYTRKDLTDNGKRHIGIIADDLAKIVPELVHVPDNDDEMKSVSYSNMVALLVEAIKEQQSQIEDLKQQIDSLKRE